jgi:phage recombination protein Bet
MGSDVATARAIEVVRAARALEFAPEQRQMIRDMYAKGSTDDEFAMLMAIAQARGLNPITKQIHFVKRWDSRNNRSVWSAQASIDGLRATAERTGLYAGQDEPEYIERDGAIVACKVRVYRKDWGSRPAVGVAYWSEYVQIGKDGKPTDFWRRMPHVMIAKCAEALGIRKAFPEDCGGLYTPEEMAQADNPTTLDAQVVETTPALPSGLDRLRDELSSAETFEQVVQCYRDNVPDLARASANPLGVLHAARRACLARLEDELHITGKRTAFNAAAGDAPAHRGDAAAAEAMATPPPPAESHPEDWASVPAAMQALQADILLVTTLDEAATCWRLHRPGVATLTPDGRRQAWEALVNYVKDAKSGLGIANAADAVRNAVARADRRDDPPPPKGGGKRTAKPGASADAEGGRADDVDGPDDTAARAREFTGRWDGAAWDRHLRSATSEFHAFGSYRSRIDRFRAAAVLADRRESTVAEFARRRGCSLEESGASLRTFLENRTAA